MVPHSVLGSVEIMPALKLVPRLVSPSGVRLAVPSFGESAVDDGYGAMEVLPEAPPQSSLGTHPAGNATWRTARRPSVSAHTSPRRASSARMIECASASLSPASLRVDTLCPPHARFRASSGGNSRPVYGRSSSSTCASSLASTGTNSVASFSGSSASGSESVFGSAASHACAPCVSPPALDMFESEAEVEADHEVELEPAETDSVENIDSSSIDAESASDVGDALVSGMRASHITASASVEGSLCSSRANSPPTTTTTSNRVLRSNNSSGSGSSSSTSSQYNTHSTTTNNPTTSSSSSSSQRASRKRRSSRLHASSAHTPLVGAATPTAVLPSLASAAPVAATAAAHSQYHPGQNKRQQNRAAIGGGELAIVVPSSSSVDIVAEEVESNTPPAAATATATKDVLLPEAPCHFAPQAAAAAETKTASPTTRTQTHTPTKSLAPAAEQPQAQSQQVQQPPQQVESSSAPSTRNWGAASRTRSCLVSVLACVLDQLFSNPGDTLPSDLSAISMFHTERIPAITVGAYLDRIAYYSECSEEALVMAFIHISRIYHASNAPVASGAGSGVGSGGAKPFQLNSLSIHRLLLVAIMASAKFYDDSFFNNKFFGKIGGVSTRELNALEVEFLALIAFELYIPARIYRRFYKELTMPALHPTCACAFRHLPPLAWDESLPHSPAHDCDLDELRHDLEPKSVRDTPETLPSPITPVTQACHHSTTDDTVTTAVSHGEERPAADAPRQS